VTGSACFAHELEPGIGYKRRPGIGDKSNALARGQFSQHARPLFVGVVLMVGPHRRVNAEVRQQCAAVTRIFAVDGVRTGQHGQRSQRDVRQISDGRGD
jgi:hypothetical protein